MQATVYFKNESMFQKKYNTIRGKAKGTARSGNSEHPAFPASVQPVKEYYGSCYQDRPQTCDVEQCKFAVKLIIK
jgi:hypothetical protein